MIEFAYALEKLGGAVYSLAIGVGRIQERLESAFAGFHPLTEDNFPEELRSDYRAIVEGLTREKAQGSEGRVKATLSKMSDADAQDLATKIVNLSYRIEEYVREQEGQRKRL